MDFKQWVENRYRHPVVIVLASPTVDNSCRRNGMDLIHMLRPFAVSASDLFARIGERSDPLIVRNFGVRLTRVQCVREASPSLFVWHLRRLLRDHAAMEMAYGEQLDRALSSLLNASGGVVEGPRPPAAIAVQLLERLHPAWHGLFVRDYAHLVRCSYFETMDHPVGCIYAVSTSSMGGVDGIMRELTEMQRRPDATRRDMPCMDDELHAYYLLVHDVTEGPSLDEARRMFAALQTRFGHSFCALVKLNSVTNPQEMKSMDPSMWIDANPTYLDVPSSLAAREFPAEASSLSETLNSTISSNASGDTGSAGGNTGLQFPRVHTVFGRWPSGVAKVTGCYMSPEDVEGLRHVMGYYISQCLFSFVERKLRALTLAVNEKRTTTLAKVAAWFRNKDEARTKSECWVAGRDGTPSKYLAASLEMQMRRAGDLSLVLSDYESAFSYYRMCRNELLSTLPSRDFNRPLIAACQEAMGICDMLVGRLPMPSATPWLTGNTATKNNGDCRLEIAQNDYVLCHVQTYALRLSLLMYEYCRTRSPPMLERARSALVYVQRIGLISQSKLYDAVLHELLANVSLFLNPPRPAGLMMPAVIPNNFAVRSHIRRYARYTVVAGNAYLEENLLENALRCYLRALRVFSGVGRRGNWTVIYEHLHTLIAHIYHRMNKFTRGIAVTTIPVSIGTPMYSNASTGLRNFDTFWDRQKEVLASLGYTLCPHMVAPCVVPDSIHVCVNVYHDDDATSQVKHLLGEEFARTEWRTMEDLLRTHYVEKADNSFSPRHFLRWREDPDRMQLSKSENGGRRRYAMHLGEPLGITVTLRNPLGGPLCAENLSLLYVSAQKTDQLWKSTASLTVNLDAGAKRVVSIAFSPSEEGSYVVIGFSWTLRGTEGYYYFSTQAESRRAAGDLADAPETVVEYAMEHPTPKVDAEENIEIVVGPPRAWLSARLKPELPAVMRDGEYFHTSLILTNGSAHRAARAITLQRSAQNAHLLWIGAFGLERNLNTSETFVIDKDLAPKETITLAITIQAQHARDTPAHATNTHVLLVGYVADTAAERSIVPDAPEPYVRLHWLLRRVVVKPSLRLASTVLPPANAWAAAAVMLTAHNVTSAPEPPLRVARVMAVHRPCWRVAPTFLSTLLDESAVECLVPPGGALSIPLNVTDRKQQQKQEEEEKEKEEEEGGEKEEEKKKEEEEEEEVAAMNGKKEHICNKEGEMGEVNKKAHMKQNGRTTGDEAHGDLCNGTDCLIEEECVPLRSALPSATRSAAVAANISDGVAGVAMNTYFMRGSFRGPGAIGIGGSTRENGGGFAFYLDGATRTAAAAPENHSQRSSRATPFTPLCIAVAWALVNESSVCSGQLFHFVDPVECLLAAHAVVAEAHARRQEALCASLVENRSLHPRDGALLVHVTAPRDVTTDTDKAHIPVTLHCRALATQPLLVSVTTDTIDKTDKTDKATARSTQRPQTSPVPIVFVGKSSCAFLVLPHESHTVTFTACAFAPGIAQCNLFDIQAVALRLSPSCRIQLRTGMSRVAVASALWKTAPAPLSLMPLDPPAALGPALCTDVSTLLIGNGAAAITRVAFTATARALEEQRNETAAHAATAFAEEAAAHTAQRAAFQQRLAALGEIPSVREKGLTPAFRPLARASRGPAGGDEGQSPAAEGAAVTMNASGVFGRCTRGGAEEIDGDAVVLSASSPTGERE